MNPGTQGRKVKKLEEEEEKKRGWINSIVL